MDFTLTGTMAYLTNISTDTFVDDFNNVKAHIPDNVTIQFEPSQPDTMVADLNTGRQMYVNVVQSYATQYYADGTMVVVPADHYYQQLLPVPTPPVQT